MKKLILFTLVVLSQYLISQNDTIYVNGVPKITKRNSVGSLEPQSPLKKDDYLYEISFGVPFNPTQEASLFGIGAIGNTSNIVNKKNLHHICANADYQLNEEYSVGLELTYAQSQFTYKRQYFTAGTAGVKDSTYTMKASKIRFLAKMSYHFNISEKFDAFLIGGFGYKQFKYSTNDSYFNSLNLSGDVLPLAIRMGIGGRFFISKDVAIHAEGGVGGPLMQIGLSYKMH